MNPRIQEFARQAGFIPGIMGLNRYTYFDPEKFAELIIQQCAYIAGGYFGPSRSAKQAILEHFEISEWS